jgi:uncharacterized protein YggL (DUF469 family)
MIHLPQSKSRARRLNPRQRKKLRLGEFQELVFALHWTNQQGLSEAELDAQLDELIELIESRGLLFGGGFSPNGGDGIVTRAGRSSTSAADRDALVKWLRNHRAVLAVEAGEFVDGWYGWYD